MARFAAKCQCEEYAVEGRRERWQKMKKIVEVVRLKGRRLRRQAVRRHLGELAEMGENRWMRERDGGRRLGPILGQGRKALWWWTMMMMK